jgi:hypothetical protein
MTKTNKEKEDASKKRAASKKLTAQQQDAFIMQAFYTGMHLQECIQQCL